MSMVKESFSEGMRKQEYVKDQIKYLVFSIMSVAVYHYTGYNGLMIFYGLIFGLDYILEKYEVGE